MSLATTDSLISASSSSFSARFFSAVRAADQVDPVPGHVPQPPDLRRRHEAGPDHLPLSDLAQPDRVELVGLRPAGQVLHVPGVDQPGLEPVRLQHVRGPAPQHLVEPVQQDGQGQMRVPLGQCSHLRLDRRDSPGADRCRHSAWPRPSSGATGCGTRGSQTRRAGAARRSWPPTGAARPVRAPRRFPRAGRGRRLSERCTKTTKSSAYAEARVMPTCVGGWPGQSGGRVLDVGIILRGSLVICLSGSCQWFLQTGR